MSDYIVSARKYRPTSFDNVVGQSALTTTLKNAIATGKLAHAYLFCGPRGVGKTTSARIFAKTINCLTPTDRGEACEQCESCQAFNEGRSYNIHELDAASNNSVDDIRSLIEQVQVPPQVGRYKVFIIDEVHMLSQAGFNAFLKTLEEPPAHAIFILATTEKHKILPIILALWQIYDFARMEVSDVVAHLQHVAQLEGYTAEESALHVIAQKADGGMRDALSIFDQVAAYTGGNITYDKVIENLNVLDYDVYFTLTDHLRNVEIPQAMLLLNSVLARGFEGQHFLTGLAAHFRDLLVARDAATLPLLEVAQNVQQRYHEQAKATPPRFLYAALKLCSQCDLNYRTSSNKRLLVELTLIQVAQLMQTDDVPGSGLCPNKRLLPIFVPVAPQAASQAPVAATIAPAAPTSTPRPAAPPTAPAVKRTSTYSQQMRDKLRTVSLRNPHAYFQSDQPAAPTATAPTEQRRLRREPFTIDRLAYACMLYANQLPQEHAAAAGRLKAIATEPTRFKEQPVGDDNLIHYDIIVDSDMAANHLQHLAAEFEAFTAAQLANDFIRFRFVADDTQVVKRKAYTAQEAYQLMLQKSEGLGMLVKAFNLQLR